MAIEGRPVSRHGSGLVFQIRKPPSIDPVAPCQPATPAATWSTLQGAASGGSVGAGGMGGWGVSGDHGTISAEAAALWVGDAEADDVPVRGLDVVWLTPDVHPA